MKIEAYGVRGMKNKRWRRTFWTWEQMLKWAERNDAEIHGTRIIEND